MLVLINAWWAPELVRGFTERKTLAPHGNQTKIPPVYSLVTTSTTFFRFVNKYQCADERNEKEGHVPYCTGTCEKLIHSTSTSQKTQKEGGHSEDMAFMGIILKLI